MSEAESLREALRQIETLEVLIDGRPAPAKDVVAWMREIAREALEDQGMRDE